MKILITGGAGFIASHITDKYIDLGHEVTIIDNLSTGRKENVNPKATFHHLDLSMPEAIDVIANGKFDIVSHHAAQVNVRKSVSNPIEDAELNIINTIKVFQAASQSGVKKVIYASSGGTVYGESNILPSTENDICNPCSPYGINKLLGEKYLYYYKEIHGLDFVALRYANVYGPRQNPHGECGVVSIFISKMFDNDNPVVNGDGLITRDYIYIDDVVDANVAVLDSKISGIYNVATGIENTTNTIFDYLKKFTGYQGKRVHGEQKIGEQMRSCCSIAKLNSHTNWLPKVELEQGIKRTVEYYLPNL